MHVLNVFNFLFKFVHFWDDNSQSRFREKQSAHFTALQQIWQHNPTLHVFVTLWSKPRTKS